MTLGREFFQAKMRALQTSTRILAPLQRAMLATGKAGCHVEQVELILKDRVSAPEVSAAWAQTVAQTEALQITFPGCESWDWAAVIPPLQVRQTPPAEWDKWLEHDRAQPLLLPQTVPWRAVYWPRDGRLVWTFHHALLDGRSIVRILQSFLDRLAGEPTAPLRMTRWESPSVHERETAEALFHRQFAGLERVDGAQATLDRCATRARRCLGNDFHHQLSLGETTVATQVLWAWGQALLARSEADTVLVEQVRAGAPQLGTAGFTMNSLPLLIHHARDETLPEFRQRLLALREIEHVSARDFPEIYRHECSVIMVEHGTLQHQVGRGNRVKSIHVHEPIGEIRTATAYLLPDLTLEVEGAGRHDLLDAWVQALQALIAANEASRRKEP